MSQDRAGGLAGSEEEASRSALQNTLLWSLSRRNTLGMVGQWERSAGKVTVELTDIGRQQVRAMSSPCKASWAAFSWHRHKQGPPACTETCCLPTDCAEVSQKAVAFVWGLVFVSLASQESSPKLLLRNDRLGSSSGIILQAADAAAGCQAALIPGSFPTLTGCRAQNNHVTVTNENGCLCL